MIVILRRGADEEHIQKVVSAIEDVGFRAHISRGEERTIVGVIGTSPEMRPRLLGMFRGMPFVDRVVPVLKPYKLVSSLGCHRSLLEGRLFGLLTVRLRDKVVSKRLLQISESLLWTVKYKYCGDRLDAQ